MTTHVTASHEAGDLHPGQRQPAAAQPLPGGRGPTPHAQLPDAGPPGAGPPDVQLPDAELLHRHVGGDPDAFGALFLRHRDRLWAVALRTLGDPEEAADALQDAMISAFRRASGFRGDSAVTTWLHRIVINACLDRLRRRAARPVSAGLDEQTLGLLTRETQVPDPGGDSDTALEVTAALRTLPEEQRAALVLVDMLGYPVVDAAEALGISVGTVKSRCARGRARLVPKLAHLRGGPPPAAPPAGEQGSSPRPGQAGDTPAADAGPADPGPARRNPAPPGYVSPAERGGESRP